MNPHTFIITNREETTSGNGGIWFGDDLSKEEDRLSFASTELIKANGKPRRKNFNLTAMSEADLVQQLRQIAAEETSGNGNGRPWIIFTHGNNQVLKKNLRKSAKIQKRYNANLLIFSWPSRSYNPKFGLRIVAALAALALNPKLAAKLALSAVKKRKKQYKEAREMARESVPDARRTHELLTANFLRNLPADRTISLLIHSLGNYLFEEMIRGGEGHGFGDYKLDNLLLHQADVEASKHHEWVKDIDLCDRPKILVTHNTGDSVLFFSSLANTALIGNGLSARHRLGNQPSIDEHVSGVTYKDFSAMEGIEMEHGIAWAKYVGDPVKNFFKGILE